MSCFFCCTSPFGADSPFALRAPVRLAGTLGLKTCHRQVFFTPSSRSAPKQKGHPFRMSFLFWCTSPFGADSPFALRAPVRLAGTLGLKTCHRQVFFTPSSRSAPIGAAFLHAGLVDGDFSCCFYSFFVKQMIRFASEKFMALWK